MSFFAHRRRGRGYAFESSIVKFFEDHSGDEDWHARRLGGSSTGMPDIVVTNNKQSILFTIEAKSTFQGEAYIDSDQILRCNMVNHIFGVYKKKYIVFAFKFSKNPAKGRDKLRYYFFKVTKIKSINNIEWVKCFYDGRLRYKLASAGDEIVRSDLITAELKVIKYDKLVDLKNNNIIQKQEVINKDWT